MHTTFCDKEDAHAREFFFYFFLSLVASNAMPLLKTVSDTKVWEAKFMILSSDEGKGFLWLKKVSLHMLEHLLQ